MKKKAFYFCILLQLLMGIKLNAQHNNNYTKELTQWYRQRTTALLATNGWVNLAGLFWLEPGKNSFGSDSSNRIVFADPRMPAEAGYFENENGVISWVTHAGVTVLDHDSLFRSGIIYADEKADRLLTLGSFRWNIIKRENKYGVRLRDLASPALENFKEIERFPIDTQWRIAAHLEKSTSSDLLITNVLGQTSAVASAGRLVFAIHQQTYTLDAMPEGDKLFIVFGDATSGKETYAAGRFIDVDLPDKNGNTTIDFNKAYNPPCAFTHFATCPLPPKQNILPVKINAGEKDYQMKSQL